MYIDWKWGVCASIYEVCDGKKILADKILHILFCVCVNVHHTFASLRESVNYGYLCVHLCLSSHKWPQ